MEIGVYEVSIQEFSHTLINLRAILLKAQDFAQSRKIDLHVLFETRLFPDMFPLSKQIQVACDTAKLCASRLTGKEPPKFDDSEKEMKEFIHRIDATVEFLKNFKHEDFKNYEAKEVTFPWSPGQKLSGRDYLIQFAIPNFYFHVTTAYNILRASGVELGKADFLGQLSWKPA